MASIIMQAEADRADASRSRAELTVMERENRGLRDAAETRKRKRAGFTVKNLGTHVFTTEAILRQKVVAEALTASRKRKGKDKAAQGSGQELVGTEYASFSDVEPGMGDIQRFGDEYA